MASPPCWQMAPALRLACTCCTGLLSPTMPPMEPWYTRRLWLTPMSPDDDWYLLAIEWATWLYAPVGMTVLEWTAELG